MEYKFSVGDRVQHSTCPTNGDWNNSLVEGVVEQQTTWWDIIRQTPGEPTEEQAIQAEYGENKPMYIVVWEDKLGASSIFESELNPAL